jgi:hypothetical protein
MLKSERPTNLRLETGPMVNAGEYVEGGEGCFVEHDLRASLGLKRPHHSSSSPATASERFSQFAAAAVTLESGTESAASAAPADLRPSLSVELAVDRSRSE